MLRMTLSNFPFRNFNRERQSDATKTIAYLLTSLRRKMQTAKLLEVNYYPILPCMYTAAVNRLLKANSEDIAYYFLTQGLVLYYISQFLSSCVTGAQAAIQLCKGCKVGLSALIS